MKEDDLLDLHPTTWIAPTAQLYGKIAIGEGSSVWHNVVARAECQRIRIGRMTNIQDFSMLHVGYSAPTTIGDFCSVDVDVPVLYRGSTVYFQGLLCAPPPRQPPVDASNGLRAN